MYSPLGELEPPIGMLCRPLHSLPQVVHQGGGQGSEGEDRCEPPAEDGEAGGGGRLGASPPVFLAPRGAIAYHLVSAWLDTTH